MVDIDRLRRSNPERSKVEFLKSEAAAALEIDPGDIEDFVMDGRPGIVPRFSYGFTNNGFLKITTRTDLESATEKLNRILRKEAKIHHLIEDLGIPTTKMIGEYRISPSGLGVLLYERLDLENGVILEGPEAISEAPPEIGERVANNFDVVSGIKIPLSIDEKRLQILRRLDKRKADPELLRKHWNWLKSRVLAKRYDNWRNNIIERYQLQNIIEQAELLINTYIERDDKSKNEYFMHNDMAPSNTYIPNPINSTDGPVIFMDFEHSGVLNNRTLALLSDLGNFYRRCWPNPKMQERFIISYLRNSERNNLHYTYALLKSAVVGGTITIGRWGMDAKRSSEHKMAVALLSNLKPNLDALDEEYSLLKSKN